MTNPFPYAVGLLRLFPDLSDEKVRARVETPFHEELLKRNYKEGFRYARVGRGAFSFQFDSLDKLHPEITELVNAKSLFSDMATHYGLDMYAHGSHLFFDELELRTGLHGALSLNRIVDLTLTSRDFEVNFRDGDIVFRADRQITDGELARLGFVFDDVFSQYIPGQDVKTLEEMFKK